jgi:hypothetical protein
LPETSGDVYLIRVRKEALRSLPARAGVVKIGMIGGMSLLR